MALLRSSVFGSPGRETFKDRTRGDDFEEGWEAARKRRGEKLRRVPRWFAVFRTRENRFTCQYILNLI